MPAPARTTRLRVALGACLGALAACGDPAAPSEPISQTRDPGLSLPAGPAPAVSGQTLGSLGFDTVALSAVGTPLYLGGHADLVARDGEDARALFRAALAAPYRLSAGSDLRPASEDRDERGARYLRLQQTHEGVPVVGAEVIVQTDPRGAVEAVLGQLVPDLGVSTTPSLTGDVALTRALDAIARPGAVVHKAPELRVFVKNPTSTEPARLAYRALVEYDGDSGHRLDEVFADAHTGALLARRSRVYTALSREIYDLKQTCVKDGTELPGMSLFNEGGTTMDTTAKAVYDNTGLTYWFYNRYFNRDSYDNAGARLRSSAHAQFFDGMNCTKDNAAWIGEGFDQMAYGDGDLIFLGNPALALDVTAHELTHAVTNKTSDLAYENESGALNEALSDIMGVTAKAWADNGGGPNGNPAQILPKANTWKVGDKAAGLLTPGGALRFMNNPTQDGVSKDNYAERYVGMQDNGGVHLNSGIANLAYYLISVGGAHPRMKTASKVKGLGMDKAVKIFYLTDTQLLTSMADFQAARYASARAAELLYGRCSAEWASVHTAWDTVGVLGSWRRCPQNPGGF